MGLDMTRKSLTLADVLIANQESQLKEEHASPIGARLVGLSDTRPVDYRI